MILVQGLSYRFQPGGPLVLRDLSLAVERGEMVVIAGPSGCGKSTLALAIAGYLFHQYDGEATGTVSVGGLDARRAPIYDLAEVVGLVQQNPEAQLCTLTVRDEVAFGLENRRLPPAEIRERLVWALDVVGAGHLLGRDLATLSGGEKQKVAIAAVLAARPQVLIFDEPTSNLDPPATADVFRVIAQIRAQAGLTVLVIEHKLEYLLRFQPRLLAMEEGRIVYDGPATLARRPRLPRRPPIAAPAPAEPLVRVENLHVGYGGTPVLCGLSFTVRPGEFVAVMGDNGSGKTTLLRSLLGLQRPSRGRVLILGQDTGHTPVSRRAAQVGLVFQNPDHQLFAESVWQEATLTARSSEALDAPAEAQAMDLVEGCGLAERLDDHPYRLSYGQKRRLNLVSALVTAPCLLLLDEVLIGQDYGNAALLLDLLGARVAAGAAVIMVTHDPLVVSAYATRLLFLAGGRVVIDAPPEEAFRKLAALGRGAYLPSLPAERAPTPVALPAERAPMPTTQAAKRRIAYQPGRSFLHRLHPLVKAAWLVGGTVLVFVVRSPWPVVAGLALALVAGGLAGLRLDRVRGMRLLVTTALFLALLQLAFVREGQVLAQIGPLAPTAGGLSAAVYIAGRFLVVVLLSYLFVLSTDPADLAYALVRAGLPYRYGLALITALRLLPVFEAEGEIVYQAQLARGIQYDVRSPRRFVTLGRQFFLPLLVSALGKVDALAISMEGRCFGKYPTRTYLQEVRLGPLDAAGVALLLLALLTVLGLPGL